MDSLSGWLPVPSLVFLLLCFQAVGHLEDPCSLKRTTGDSAQLQFTPSSSDIREIEWTWDPERDKNSVLLVSWRQHSPDPEWYQIDEKYRQRLSLTEMASLSISNLTVDMSGLYTAKTKFNNGNTQEKAFRLCVYEPTPQPQILIRSSSHTASWCNLSLECEAPGDKEHLTVSWESQGLSGELGQWGNSTVSLSLSLSLNQTNTSLTCVLSSPVEQKRSTLHLAGVCAQAGESSDRNTWLWILLPVALLAVLGSVWICKRRKTTKRGRCWGSLRRRPEGGQDQGQRDSLPSPGSHLTGSWGAAVLRNHFVYPQNGAGGSTLRPAAPGSAAAPQPHPREEAADLQTGETQSLEPAYSEISLLKHPEAYTEKGSAHAAKAPATYTIYEKIRTSPQPAGTFRP